MAENPKPALQPWRAKLHEIVFESHTAPGRAFDSVSTIIIILSIMVVILESISSIKLQYGYYLTRAEWVFTIIFTADYLLRLLIVRQPSKYAFSFFGIMDFLSAIPTYLSLFIPGAQAFLVIRSVRLLRMFRLFKMSRYVKEADLLMVALRASRPKITVFIFSVLTVVMIVGTLMYAIEPHNEGFSSIPTSIYWAIVTMTTVGFGDITPITNLGKLVASVLMVLGYGMIAVPTGIVGAEIAMASKKQRSLESCQSCGQAGHDEDAFFCKICGGKVRDGV